MYKIALIGPVFPYRGGIAHHTTLLDQALRESGNLTRIISFKRLYPKWLYPGKSDKDPSEAPLKVTSLNILDPFQPWTWMDACKSVEQFNPDLVIIQWWTTFWAFQLSIISKYLSIKKRTIVYLVHNVLPHESHYWDRWLVLLAFNQSQFFIAQSNQEKDRLLELMPQANIKVCPIPIFSKLYNSNISKDEARRSLGLPLNSSILLFFGIVRRYKGLNVLIEALKILKMKNIHPLLLITGEFWDDKQSYVNLIDKYHLEKQIWLKDEYIPNEQVDLYFKAADVLVAPYVGGTQSAVIALAQAYGMTIISTDAVADGISSSSESNLLIVPSGNAEALAEAIRNTLMQPETVNKNPEPSISDWQRLVLILNKMANTS